MAQESRRICRAGRKGVAVTAVAIVVVGISSCSPPKSSEGTSGDATLHYGIIGNKNDKRYPYVPTLSSSQGMKNYEAFVTLTDHTRSGKLKMALAKKMTPEASYKKWSIQLRKDVKFSDGSQLTAQDVVYSIRKMFSKKHPSSAKKVLATAKVDPAKVTVKGKHVVTVNLNGSVATLPEVLSFADIVIMSKESGYDHPVGTGPFKLTKFKADTNAKFKRNPHYGVKTEVPNTRRNVF